MKKKRHQFLKRSLKKLNHLSNLNPMNVFVTKRYEFDAAHRLPNHKGACRYIHGHRYAIEVTVKATVNSQANSPTEGMVIDFQDLKEIVKNQIVDVWDHTLLLYKNDPLLKNSSTFIDQRVVQTDYVPTAENMARDAFESLKKRISDMSSSNPITLVKVRLYETPTTWVDVEL